MRRSDPKICTHGPSHERHDTIGVPLILFESDRLKLLAMSSLQGSGWSRASGGPNRGGESENWIEP